MATETSKSPGLGRARRSDLPYVDVRQFGAVPGSSLDQSAAFHLAMAEGLPVFVPEGEFFVNLTISAANVQLFGAGRELTTLRNFADAAIVTINNASASIRNTRLKGMTLRNRDKATYTAADGLVIIGDVANNECDFGVFEDLLIFQMRYNVRTKGRTIWNSWRQVNLVEAITDGFYAEADGNQSVQRFELCRFAANGRHGIRVDALFAGLPQTSWSFQQHTLENNISGAMRITGTDTIQSWEFNGGHAEENASGIAAGTTTGARKVAFLQIDCAGVYGFDIKNSSFLGNTAVANPDHYVWIDDATTLLQANIDLCRFGTVVVHTIRSPGGLTIGARNVNETVDIDRTAGDVYEKESAIPQEWTPLLNFGGNRVGMTQSNSVGRYTINGRTVTLTCYVSLSAKGSSTGVATISGLPFASLNATNFIQPIVMTGTSLGATGGMLLGEIDPNTSAIKLYGYTPGDKTQLTDAEFGNFSAFAINATYMI